MCGPIKPAIRGTHYPGNSEDELLVSLSGTRQVLTVAERSYCLETMGRGGWTLTSCSVGQSSRHGTHLTKTQPENGHLWRRPKSLRELLSPFLQLEVNALRNIRALNFLNERDGSSLWWPQLWITSALIINAQAQEKQSICLHRCVFSLWKIQWHMYQASWSCP